MGISDGEAAAAAGVVMVDACTGNGEALRIRAGPGAKNFRLLPARRPGTRKIRGRRGTGASLTARGGGRRCTLALRHMLFMYLEYARHGVSRDCVAAFHGISRTSLQFRT